MVLESAEMETWLGLTRDSNTVTEHCLLLLTSHRGPRLAAFASFNDSLDTAASLPSDSADLS